MRLGTLLTMTLAIVLGGVAAVLAKVWLESQVPQPQAAPAPERQVVETRHVVVASQPLRFGAELSSQNLKEVEWPVGAIPSGAFNDMNDLLGEQKRSVLSSIEQNEPVLKWKITGPGQRASLSALISDGDMKAVTIRVNDVKGVAGFVLPGDRVDVFLTRTETVGTGDGKDTRQFTDLLLQNIKVLAVDQIADDRKEDPTVAKAVTLEVNTTAAQKLVLASSAGTLSLALRRAGATAAAGGRRITLGDLGIPSVGAELPPKEEKQEEVAVIEEPDIYSLVGVTRGVKRNEVSVPKKNASGE